MAGQDIGQVVGDHRVDHGLRRRDIAIDIRHDCHYPLAIDPADRGIAASEGGPGHAAERYLGAVGGANAHRLQVAQRASFTVGETHHHPDVILAPLDPLGLVTVECLPHLPTEVLQGDPQIAGFRQQGQLYFLLARAEAVTDIEYAIITLQGGAQFRRNVAQAVKILAIELKFDGVTCTEGLGGKGQLDGIGNATGEFAPAVGHGAGRFAFVPRWHVELDTDLREVALGALDTPDTALGNKRAHAAENVVDHAGLALLVARVQFRPQVFRRLLESGYRS